MKKILEALSEMQTKMPIQTILIVLIVAFILAMIVYFTYKYTYNGVLYNPRFNLSLVVIILVTTIVMVVIGSNISVSLGMVGALSIVRFRTAVKDPRDTAFIFWGIVIGLACGTQNYYIAIIGSLFICLVLFGFKKFICKDNRYVLIVRGNKLDITSIDSILKKQVECYKCKGKYINKNDVELIYDLKFKKDINDNMINTVYQINGVETVNLIQNNTETMG